MRARLSITIAVGVALALSLAGTAAGAGTPSAPAADAPSPPTARQAWVGRVLVRVTARTAPRFSARRKAVVETLAPFEKGPTVLLITRAVEIDGVRWVEVLLPIRPNGARGWIPQDVVRLSLTRVRIAIDLGDRRLRVLRGGRQVMSARIAIGMAGTPTPTGRFFAIAETIETNTPGGFLGPIVMPLTGFSETLNEFAGGDGRVAIHGTSLPSLIGTQASHGCMRMLNADILRLARLAAPGTPVAISA